MDDEVFEDYDRELELALYKEYRDVVSQFQYVIETERRFYLANDVNVVRRDTEHDFYFEISMTDVWVWDIYRADRFVKSVRVLTFKDVNVEELQRRFFLEPSPLIYVRTGIEPPRSWLFRHLLKSRPPGG